MAKTKTKPGKSDFQIRTVRTKEDRKRPSVFMRLKVDEAFKAFALFEPDPELESNPGYYEYYDHYDKQANQYVPCVGDKCPFCAANDNPSTRAITAWYFPDAGDAKDRVKLFTMNYSTTTDASDESEDEDGILGKLVRIKRLSDKGDYKVKITGGKSLSKNQLKEAMKLLDEKIGEDGLEGLVLKQAKAQMERLKALDAMEDDDDDDDEEETPKARKGKAAKAQDTEDDDDDDDEAEAESIEDEEVEILKVSKKNKTLTVSYNDSEITLAADEDVDLSDLKKGETITISADQDEDGDWTLTEISSEEEEEDDEEEEEEKSEDDDDDDDDDSKEEEESETISGVTYTVLKTNEKNETIDVDTDDGKVTLWLGEGVDVDYDAVKKGVKVTVDAEKDDEGDWIVTALKTKKGSKKGK